MYCADCNKAEVYPNPYGIDVCSKCLSKKMNDMEIHEIGQGYTIEVYERLITELKAKINAWELWLIGTQTCDITCDMPCPAYETCKGAVEEGWTCEREILKYKWIGNKEQSND